MENCIILNILLTFICKHCPGSQEGVDSGLALRREPAHQFALILAPDPWGDTACVTVINLTSAPFQEEPNRRLYSKNVSH